MNRYEKIAYFALVATAVILVIIVFIAAPKH